MPRMHVKANTGCFIVVSFVSFVVLPNGATGRPTNRVQRCPASVRELNALPREANVLLEGESQLLAAPFQARHSGAQLGGETAVVDQPHVDAARASSLLLQQADQRTRFMELAPDAAEVVPILRTRAVIRAFAGAGGAGSFERC
jgi:hypothetical protein